VASSLPFGPFPRISRRTRRAPLSATGSPRLLRVIVKTCGSRSF